VNLLERLEGGREVEVYKTHSFPEYKDEGLVCDRLRVREEEEGECDVEK